MLNVEARASDSIEGNTVSRPADGVNNEEDAWSGIAASAELEGSCTIELGTVELYDCVTLAELTAGVSKATATEVEYDMAVLEVAAGPEDISDELGRTFDETETA